MPLRHAALIRHATLFSAAPPCFTPLRYWRMPLPRHYALRRQMLLIAACHYYADAIDAAATMKAYIEAAIFATPLSLMLLMLMILRRHDGFAMPRAFMLMLRLMLRMMARMFRRVLRYAPLQSCSADATHAADIVANIIARPSPMPRAQRYDTPAVATPAQRYVRHSAMPLPLRLTLFFEAIHAAAR